MMMGNDTESIALLIHVNKATKSSALVSHKVVKTKGGFTLGAGKLFSDADKIQLNNIINDVEPDSFWIDDNLLYKSPEAIVWFKPAGTYPISFRNNDFEAPYPAHVFMVKQGKFYAFALKKNKKPSMHTKLYYAPTLNVYDDGSVCLGNISIPKNISTANISTWERFYFEGRNTHSGSVQTIKGRTDDESHIEFWKELSQSSKDKFPKSKLVSTNQHLRGII